MKKLFLFLATGLLFAATSNAQVQRKTPRSQQTLSDSAHHHQKGMMMDQLNLTTDQKAQMKTLHQNMKQQRESIMNDQSLTVDQKKQKMKEFRKSQQEKVNGILTPDQQQKMKELRKQRMKNHKINRKMQPAEAS